VPIDRPLRGAFVRADRERLGPQADRDRPPDIGGDAGLAVEQRLRQRHALAPSCSAINLLEARSSPASRSGAAARPRARGAAADAARPQARIAAYVGRTIAVGLRPRRSRSARTKAPRKDDHRHGAFAEDLGASLLVHF